MSVSSHAFAQKSACLELLYSVVPETLAPPTAITVQTQIIETACSHFSLTIHPILLGPQMEYFNARRHLCPILWKIIIIHSYISYMPKNTNSMWNILDGNVIYPIACVWLLEGANCEDSPTFEIGLVFLCNHVQASPFTSGETCTIWIWRLLSTSISLKAKALKKQTSWNRGESSVCMQWSAHTLFQTSEW